MSTLQLPPAAPAPSSKPRQRPPQSPPWRLRDRVGLGLAWLLGLLFCAIAIAIVVYFMVQGIRYLRPSMLVTNPSSSTAPNAPGGFLDPLLGTLLVVVMALAIALPVGVGLAVWLSEYGRPTALARVCESTVEMIAGVPSIVFALFGLLLFESRLLGFLSQTSGGVTFGRSFFAAGTMLSLVALPLIVTNTRAGLQAIPDHVREASYALGKTKATTTRRVLLPAARPSLLTGTILATGRVIGDTAIILVLGGGTLMLSGAGGLPVLSTLRGTGSTLTYYIFYNAPTGEGNQPDKAYAAAFVLMLIVLALNVGADVAARRTRRLLWTS